MRTHDIHIETANGIGFIALDRPQALNALTTTMLHAIRNALGDWRHDHAIRAVVVYSPHPRAFCAGGDIRFLYEAAKAGERAAIDKFFTDEYRLNHMVFTYSKPYVAVTNGVVMGGGVGISQGAHHTGGLRVVTGSTRMAMPETRIGLFPDVGSSWFLARAPGAIGRYMAATGATIGAADALYARLADAYLDDAALPGLIETLKRERFNDAVEVMRYIETECVKHKVSPTPDASALAAARVQIDKHFASGRRGGDSRLASEGSRWRRRCGVGCAHDRRIARAFAAVDRDCAGTRRPCEAFDDGRHAAARPRPDAQCVRARRRGGGDSRPHRGQGQPSGVEGGTGGGCHA